MVRLKPGWSENEPGVGREQIAAFLSALKLQSENLNLMLQAVRGVEFDRSPPRALAGNAVLPAAGAREL